MTARPNPERARRRSTIHVTRLPTLWVDPGRGRTRFAQMGRERASDVNCNPPASPLRSVESAAPAPWNARTVATRLRDRSHKPCADYCCVRVHRTLRLCCRCMTQLCRQINARGCISTTVSTAGTSTPATTHVSRGVGCFDNRIAYKSCTLISRRPGCVRAPCLLELVPLAEQRIERNDDALRCRSLPAWHVTATGSSFRPGGPKSLFSCFHWPNLGLRSLARLSSNESGSQDGAVLSPC